jgi:hypothetical protein
MVSTVTAIEGKVNNLTTVFETTSTIGTVPIPKSRLQKVEEGLRLIISHFDPNEPLWPRMISTHLTGGSQIKVYSIEEALVWFQEADFLDCRISAYPIYTDEYINRTGIMFVPTLLLIDLDREHFGTDEVFEAAATKTIANIKKILGANPTILWTGGGYHYLIPQSIIKPLEKIDDFKQFLEPSRKFLHFEEWLMSDGKADQNHNRSVSFKNCMLRIPGSLNFGACHRNDKDEVIDIPPNAEVRIIQTWDGNRPSVNHLLPRCYMWLKAQVIKDMQRRVEADRVNRKYRRRSGEKKSTFQWIEKLLKKPIDSNRYYCTWRILVPYLINVRRLSRQEASDIIQGWLAKCNSVKRLSFNPRKVNDVLQRVGSYYPIARADLEQDNKLLFRLLKDEDVVSA